MMLTAKDVLAKARQENYALGAFNAGNLELVKAVVQAAEVLSWPVIIEVSAGEVQHFGLKNFLAVIDNLRKETGLPILTNLDHGPGLEECQQAIEAGFDLVHFDGSALPFEENIKITRQLVDLAHRQNVLIEGEIDKILGRSNPHQGENAESIQAQGDYTDPERAKEYVEKTGVDLLAVFVGNLHGTYDQPLRLDLERLSLIAERLPCLLSLHGGSGLAESDLQKAIKIGQIVKVNVNTELRVAFRETLENVLKGSDEVAVYKIMPPVMAAVQKVVEEKIKLFRLDEEVGPQPEEKAAVGPEKGLVKPLEE